MLPETLLHTQIHTNPYYRTMTWNVEDWSFTSCPHSNLP